MKLNIPEIKIPRVNMPKVKIPKVNISKPHRKNENDEPETDADFASFDDEAAADDIFDETEDTTAQESAAQIREKVKSYGMVISEDQLRMVWAGEIGFSLLIVFASVLIAIAS